MLLSCENDSPNLVLDCPQFENAVLIIHFPKSVFVLSILTTGGRQNGFSARAMGRGGPEYDSCSSFMSSELESTSCFDSEDDDATSRSDVLCSSLLSSDKIYLPSMNRPFGLRNVSGFAFMGIWKRLVKSNAPVALWLTPTGLKISVSIHLDNHL